jgi:sodium-dependent phosphate cotransporter
MLDPVLDPMKDAIEHIGFFPEISLVVFGLIILFISLTFITKAARMAIDGKVQELVDKVLFRNTMTSFTFGLLLTSFVQSSSVTTSIAVPLVGGGILSIEQIFPYTLGANVGTTITALLAAIASQDLADPEGSKYALAISFVHLYFNITGILLLMPFKKVPIFIAKKVARYISLNRKLAVVFLVVVFFIIPGSVILIDKFIL